MVPRLRITLAALALAAVATPGAAPAADPAWHAVAPPVDDFPNAGVAVRFDPLGTAFGVWNGSPAQLVTRPSAGTFGTPTTFPTSSSLPSAYGFAANGDGVFAGWDGTSVRAAFRTAGPSGGFGTVQTVAAGTIPSIAVNAGGQALLAWPSAGSSSGALNVAVRPAGAGSTFAAESLAGAGSPQVGLTFGFGFAFAALDADGSGSVVYLDRASGGRLQAIARASNGSWSGPTALSPAGPTSIDVATNSAGDALVVWSEGETVRAAVRPHDGAFGAAETIASEGGSNTLATSSVAIAADGTPLVALERHTTARRICGDSVFQIYTAELWRRSGGTWSSVVRQEGHSGTVATSPTGDRLGFAWEGFVDPCAVLNTHAIRVQLGSAAGLGPDTLLPGQPADPTFGNTNTAQSIAIDGAGSALVTWSATRPETGGGEKLRVAAFDTGSAPPGGGGGGGGGTPPGGGGTPPGGGGSGGSGGGSGDGRPTVDTTFTDLLGLRAPVRNIPVDLGSGLPTNVFVDARCIARSSRCEINANGVITGSYTAARASVARRRARATRFTIALPRATATVAAGKTARLKLTIGTRALAKVRAALRAHGTAKLTIGLTVNGVRRAKPIAIPFAAKRPARRRR